MVHKDTIPGCCRSATTGHNQKALDSGNQNKQGPPREKEGTWILDQLNLEGLDVWTDDQQKAAKDHLVDSADVFSKNDLDLGKCNILNMTSKLQTPNLLRKDTKEYQPTYMRR